MVYTVVDDWYQESGWRLVRSRPGVKPRFSDSEVLTLEVMREMEGETRERRWYARVAANWRALFPCLPERSVLHKRTKSLGLLLDRCRCAVRDRLVDPADPRRLLDGTPVPVCAVSRVGRPDGTSAGRQWQPYGAEIGRCAARAWWFYGFKLVLTATVDLLPDQECADTDRGGHDYDQPDVQQSELGLQAEPRRRRSQRRDGVRVQGRGVFGHRASKSGVR